MNFLIGGAMAAAGLGRLVRSLSYAQDDICDGNIERVHFHEFSTKVKTGDIILTSNSSPIGLNRMFTRSKWSHVGIAYVDPKTDKLYEWSSHNSAENILNSSGRICGGPQLVPMEVLSAYSGALFWKPARQPVDVNAIQRTVDSLAYKLPFSSYIEFLHYIDFSRSNVFSGFGLGLACSHLVGAVLAGEPKMIALDGRDLCDYVPESFSDTGDVKWLVKMDTTKLVIGYDARNLIRV